GGALRVRRQAGAHWRGQLGVATISPGLDLFDIATQRRGDRVEVDGSVSYLQQTPGTFWRYWEVSGAARREFNYDGQHIFSQVAAVGYFQHLTYWNALVTASWEPPALDDRLTRGGPLARRPAARWIDASFNSDFRKPVTFSAGVFLQRAHGGGATSEGSVGVTLKPSTRWFLSVGPSLSHVRVPAQFLGSVSDTTPAALFGRRYLFSPLEHTSLRLDTRFNYTFDPELSLEVFLQPLISAVNFDETTRYLAAPRTFRFVDDPVTNVRGSDFNVRSLRGNAVLRWEYRPGSTLYLAWQQRRESFQQGVRGIGDFDPGRDPRALLDAAPDNVLVLKVTYWLNP
ncbi:MAG TPA: DUF5916 domain-containing protein, partial [Longimicrobium sp.]|nr:DUF5916 domain-containing protein [Longimicrobium sp.]